MPLPATRQSLLILPGLGRTIFLATQQLAEIKGDAIRFLASLIRPDRTPGEQRWTIVSAVPTFSVRGGSSATQHPWPAGLDLQRSAVARQGVLHDVQAGREPGPGPAQVTTGPFGRPPTARGDFDRDVDEQAGRQPCLATGPRLGSSGRYGKPDSSPAAMRLAASGDGWSGCTTGTPGWTTIAITTMTPAAAPMVKTSAKACADTGAGLCMATRSASARPTPLRPSVRPDKASGRSLWHVLHQVLE